VDEGASPQMNINLFKDLSGFRMSENTSPKMSLSEKAALGAVLVNTVLTGLKFLLAWYSGSLSLKVEAFHSFADIGSSLAVFFAVRMEMNHPHDPDEEHNVVTAFLKHPQRMVSIGIGLFLAIVGILFIRQIINPAPLMVVRPVPVGLAMLFLALLSFLLARLERNVGENENCTALIADSFHARVDMFGSLVVAFALLLESIGLSLDRYAAGLIAGFILLQSINVFGAVIRDLARGEGSTNDNYRAWLWDAFKGKFPNISSRFFGGLMKLYGIDKNSEATRSEFKKKIVRVALIFIFGSYLISGFFTVSIGEQAMVERFGKPINMKEPIGPGMHWSFPWPVSSIKKVDVKNVRRLNIGSAIAPGRRTVLWTNDHYINEFIVISGERIFVDVGVVVHYRVSNAASWLYNTRDPEGVLKSVTESVIIQDFAQIYFLDSLTSERDTLEKRLFEESKILLHEYDCGIELIHLFVRDAHPPTNVAADFEQVVSAMIEYETRVNEAIGYANDRIPRAHGKYEKEVNAAMADAFKAVRTASGDVIVYSKLLDEYQGSQEVTRSRLRLEMAENVFFGREKIIIPEEASSDAFELYWTVDPGRVPGFSGE
jgi:modulator of FtsH protease HflK